MNPVVFVVRVVAISCALAQTAPVDAILTDIAHALAIQVVLLVLILHGEVVRVVQVPSVLLLLCRVLTVAEAVANHSCIPLDEVDDPSKQDRCTLVYLGQMLKRTKKGT